VQTNSFSSLGLSEPILRAVKAEGYSTPTPIQMQAIPTVLKGRDVLGAAQTGTGKTAAFALPILENLSQQKTKTPGVKVLVLAPTRELAQQIGDSFNAYGKFLQFRTAVIYGGVGHEPQRVQLRRGVDIVVATPGRLLDLQSEGVLKLNQIHTLVLDEADHMFDMGFIRDLRKIIALLPPKRQNLLFSATMPEEIAKLAEQVLVKPERIAVAPVSSTSAQVEQGVFVVNQKNKPHLLLHILQEHAMSRVLVFTRTKARANRLATFLSDRKVPTLAIHGNKSQSARLKALEHFKEGKITVLVASDLAARGIDVDEVSHVVNFDLPNVPEVYVHRIGRTGRAAATGKAYSFCDLQEKSFLGSIEKLIGKRVPQISDHPYPFDPSIVSGESVHPQQRGGGGGGRNRRRGSGGGGGGHGKPGGHKSGGRKPGQHRR
jgi:ATP-dependent RNA helicase RhlE